MEANFNLPKNDIEDRRFPYRQLQGSLLWVARATRPDISYAVSYTSQFCNCYGEKHFNALIRILQYLYTTKDKKLTYIKDAPAVSISIKAYILGQRLGPQHLGSQIVHRDCHFPQQCTHQLVSQEAKRRFDLIL